MVKRRITVEQLNELTDKQRERLRNWWKQEAYDLYASETATGELKHYGVYHWTENSEIQAKDKRLPLLDIVQMIELLEEKHGECWINKIYSVDYDHNIYPLYEGELCDALWEEVKAVL